VAESPTAQLSEEHKLVLMVVEAMEREVVAIERDDRVHAERVAEMVDFTRDFTDGCHHAKEEKILFPLLEERDATSRGTVAVLLSEHEGGRMAMRAIDDALPRVDTDAAARKTVAKNLADYAYVLRLHINKEDALLFPRADEVLADDDQRWLATEFDRVEGETGEAVHERYHSLAHDLAKFDPQA
jgi:hemerythrin-like domain-containing protein